MTQEVVADRFFRERVKLEKNLRFAERLAESHPKYHVRQQAKGRAAAYRIALKSLDRIF